MLSQNKKNDVEKYRQLFSKLSEDKNVQIGMMDMKALESKQLDGNQIYNLLRKRFKQYKINIEKQVDTVETLDTYEIYTYNSLYTILRNISSMESINDQINSLKHAKEWFDQQSKIIDSRKDQGRIRYKSLRNKAPQLIIKQDENKTNLNIPSEVLREMMIPYYKNYRTMNEGYPVPSEKLKQYKRKVLKIQPTTDFKEVEKTTRIKYPVPPIITFAKEQSVKLEQNKQNIEAITNQEVVVGQPPQLQPPAQQQKEELNIGQEPEDPQDAAEDPEENNQQDKLAPRVKIYSQAFKLLDKKRSDIESRGTFVYAMPDQAQTQRFLELKYRHSQNKYIEATKEDEQRVRIKQRWGKSKSRLHKELNKRMEDLTFRPQYSFFPEQKAKTFYFPKEQQKKYNFQRAANKTYSKNEVDFTTQLPKLSQTMPRQNFLMGYEKGVQKSRISELKRRFSNVLNLTADIEDRQLPKSICQYTTRFKNFSSVLNEHSVDKQRMIQMDEIRQIKQRLTKNKIGVNVTTLAQGLCVPEFKEQDLPFPSSGLPKNPFVVQKKKKKKKK